MIKMAILLAIISLSSAGLGALAMFWWIFRR